MKLEQKTCRLVKFKFTSPPTCKRQVYKSNWYYFGKLCMGAWQHTYIRLPRPKKILKQTTARPRDTRFLVPGKNRAAQNRASWGLYLKTVIDTVGKKRKKNCSSLRTCVPIERKKKTFRKKIVKKWWKKARKRKKI